MGSELVQHEAHPNVHTQGGKMVFKIYRDICIAVDHLVICQNTVHFQIWKDRIGDWSRDVLGGLMGILLHLLRDVQATHHDAAVQFPIHVRPMGVSF